MAAELFRFFNMHCKLLEKNVAHSASWIIQPLNHFSPKSLGHQNAIEYAVGNTLCRIVSMRAVGMGFVLFCSVGPQSHLSEMSLWLQGPFQEGGEALGESSPEKYWPSVHDIAEF